jgi:hypothetical protein
LLFESFLKYLQVNVTVFSKSNMTTALPDQHLTIKVLFVCCFVMELILGVLSVLCWLKKRRLDQQRGKLLQQLQRQRQRRQMEQTPHVFYQLSPVIPNDGPKPNKWNALVQWDPHLFPPTHGYYLLRDRQGLQRFVKAENILPPSKPRRSPCLVNFATDVGVKFIPRFNDPINSEAWNDDYQQTSAINRLWQQQQFIEEQEGKKKHNRLVVSSIKLKEFRSTVLSTLLDHVHLFRWKSSFRRYVGAALLDHSHSLRWKWALRHHHDNAAWVTLEQTAHLTLMVDDESDDGAGSREDDDNSDDEHATYGGGGSSDDNVIGDNEDEIDCRDGSGDDDITGDDDNGDCSNDDLDSRPQRRLGFIIHDLSMDRGSIWIGGLRRSSRHQPLLGSFYRNGIRRSARFL